MNENLDHKVAMVIGGGIAGVQAALDLAESGVEVFLVEQSPSIGGRMAQLDKTFPTCDCSLCILSPKLVEVGNHPRINLLTYTEIERVEGDAPSFTVTLRKKPRYINESKCNGCGICMTKCPVKIPDAYNMNRSMTKCIRVPFPQAVPAVALIDREHCTYFAKGRCRICEKFCEAGAVDFEQTETFSTVQVGSIIVAVGASEFDAVLKGEFGYRIYPDVVTSMELERIMSASGPHQGHIVRPSDGQAPRRIAFVQCIGSRDASAGQEYCSAICCMQATKDAIIIAEHLPQAELAVFGMDIRAYGKNFDKFIERAQQDFHTRFIRARISEVDIDPNTNRLIVRYAENGRVRKEAFDLLVLSVGLKSSPQLRLLLDKLGIRANEFGFADTDTLNPISTSRPGIFLCGTVSGPKDIPESVIEASAAASAAGVALSHLPARETIVEYPPEAPIDPGDRPRIGVFVCHCGINIAGVVNIKKVVQHAGALPYVVHSQDMLFACSQDAQKAITERIRELDLNRVVVAACTPRTHEPLFQFTLKKSGLNAHLFEFANIRDQCSWVHQREPGPATEKAKDLVAMAVARAASLESLADARVSVNKQCLVVGGGLAGMTAALDVADAGFRVHLVETSDQLGGNLKRMHRTIQGHEIKPWLEARIERVKSHPNIALHLGRRIQEISGYVGNFRSNITPAQGASETAPAEILHGVVIVATGAQEIMPSEYGYGQDRRIVTQRELEDRIVQKKLRIGGRSAIVMIQCVGSRDEQHPYCSRICCTQAVKNALWLKQLNPRAEVYVLYRDTRTYGFRELYYRKAREAGVIFIQYDDAAKPTVKFEGGDLGVEVREPIMNRTLSIRPDLLVLSTGIAPNPANKELSQALKVPLGTDGFFLEAHVKLRPVDFATDGVFVCGLAHFPKDVGESIAQARAAASRAVTVLSKNVIEIEGKVASVRESRCNGCGLCIAVCPYRAIDLDCQKRQAVVNAALCKGCGTCAASCRPGAVELQGFKDEQILATVAALVS